MDPTSHQYHIAFAIHSFNNSLRLNGIYSMSENMVIYLAIFSGTSNTVPPRVRSPRPFCQALIIILIYSLSYLLSSIWNIYLCTSYLAIVFAGAPGVGSLYCNFSAQTSRKSILAAKSSCRNGGVLDFLSKQQRDIRLDVE